MSKFIKNVKQVYVFAEPDADENLEDGEADGEKWAQHAVNPAHKGDLRKKAHVKEGEKIPKEKLEQMSHSENPTTRHQAQFALNIRKK